MFSRMILTALLAAGLVYAQRGSRGGGGMGGDESGMPMMRAQQPTRAQMLADKLKLDKEQRQELQNILMAGAEEAGTLRTQISNARVQLAGAIIDGKGDEAVKKAQGEYSAVAAQLAGVEAKVFAKIYALLKPNQQSRAAQGFELLAGIFEQPSRGRGMGGGAGRGERSR